MITIRRALPVAVAFTFVLASCGGSSDDGADTDADEAPATVGETVPDDTEDFTEADGSDTDAEVVEEVPEETEAAPEESGETEPAPEETDAAEEPAAEVEQGADGAFEAALLEWAIEAPTEYTAGEITFNASNDGSFPHELAVIEGEGYEALPLAEGGAVIEEELPTGALIGRTDRLGAGESEALAVTLAPGSYVLVCNLGDGENSHAGQGQRLDITVS